MYLVYGSSRRVTSRHWRHIQRVWQMHCLKYGHWWGLGSLPHTDSVPALGARARLDAPQVALEGCADAARDPHPAAAPAGAPAGGGSAARDASPAAAPAAVPDALAHEVPPRHACGAGVRARVVCCATEPCGMPSCCSCLARLVQSPSKKYCCTYPGTKQRLLCTSTACAG